VTDKQRLALLDSAIRELKETTKGYSAAGPHWKEAMERLERLRRDLSPLPDLGPVWNGGKSYPPRVRSQGRRSMLADEAGCTTGSGISTAHILRERALRRARQWGEWLRTRSVVVLMSMSGSISRSWPETADSFFIIPTTRMGLRRSAPN
jgi:hypothetical protein